MTTRKEFLEFSGKFIPFGLMGGSLGAVTLNAPETQNLNIANVEDYYGAGINDTQAFQLAINSGKTVFVPNRHSGYDLCGLEINSKVTIVGENQPTLRATESLFKINGRSSDISISNFFIDMDKAPIDTSAFLFRTSLGSIERVRLSKIRVTNAYHTIKDERSLFRPSTGGIENAIINLHVDDFLSQNTKGIQHYLNDAFAFIFYEKVVVDHTRNTVVPTFCSFLFERFEGLLLKDVDALGGITIIQNPDGKCKTTISHHDAHGIVCKNGAALWLDRVFGDTVGGYGIAIDNVIHIHANEITGSLCGQGQILFANCTLAQAQNVYCVGRNHEGLCYEPQNAIGLYVSGVRDAQFSNVVSIENTGDGVQLEKSQRCLFSNVRAQNNRAVGFVERGPESKNNTISLLHSSFNGTNGDLMLSSSDNVCVNWRDGKGEFYQVTRGPIKK